MGVTIFNLKKIGILLRLLDEYNINSSGFI